MYSNNRLDELEPRPVPKPTQFQEISAKPEVPELSVVFDSSDNISKLSDKNPSYATSQTTQETYSEWKNRQNRSPLSKETFYCEPRNKHCYASSAFNDYDQNPYNRFSDRMSYKSGSECHKCAGQNTPTVKDIYNMMQMQNDQMKFLLETIQKLLVTVLSNQQNQHKCCCFEKNYCKQNNGFKTSELLKDTETQTYDCQLSNSNDNLIDKPQNILKEDKSVPENNQPNTNSKLINKPDAKSEMHTTKNKPRNPSVAKGDNNNEKNISKEKERTYSVVSDESLDLNENDVQVIEASISPEQSIHIEMKSSSEDSSNSECGEENSEPIKVGWTMYNNILGQVNNLLEGPDVAKPIEHEKAAPTTKSKNFEPHKYFMLPENSKIDSSLQMQALAMQYLSPEQAVKFDMNKHFVSAQPTKKSPNNYSISTLHYMERYHLIGSEKNYNSDNMQHKISSEGLLNKKKKPSRKNKTPSKILNITELRQQPKLP